MVIGEENRASPSKRKIRYNIILFQTSGKYNILPQSNLTQCRLNLRRRLFCPKIRSYDWFSRSSCWVEGGARIQLGKLLLKLLFSSLI